MWHEHAGILCRVDVCVTRGSIGIGKSGTERERRAQRQGSTRWAFSQPSGLRCIISHLLVIVWIFTFAVTLWLTRSPSPPNTNTVKSGVFLVYVFYLRFPHVILSFEASQFSAEWSDTSTERYRDHIFLKHFLHTVCNRSVNCGWFFHPECFKRKVLPHTKMVAQLANIFCQSLNSHLR